MALKVYLRQSVRLLLAVNMFLSSCTGKREATFEKQEFNPLISAFTSGSISSESSIIVRMAADNPWFTESGSDADRGIFEFTPSIKGNAYWTDSRTVEFRPEKRLPSGTSYKGTFKLASVFRDRKDEKDFAFYFKTIPLAFDVSFEGMKSYSHTDLTNNQIKGKLFSSDQLSIDETESIITARQGNRTLSVSWQHLEGGKTHIFTVDSVLRSHKREIVTVSWNGAPAGLKVQGSKDFEIPGLGEFLLLDQKVIQYPEQHILLSFSDPLKSQQDMEGLIHLETNTSLRFSIEDNNIKAYPVIRQTGSLNLTVEPGIQNILGKKFSERKSFLLHFEPLKPAIRLIGNGVIIPRSEGLLFPFEAVNLRAVDVKVIRIFEDNVAQFLQVNSLDGNYELKRAGRLIAKKNISLISERHLNYGEWNAFSLDLSKIIDAEPGAIYHVELSFQRKHSLYECPDNDAYLPSDAESDRITEKDIAYWDDSDNYYGWTDYDYDFYYYDWEKREDPCSPSYYVYENKVSRNILASNLGIVAKAGGDNSMFFAVTDLRTTEPVSDVKINIFNFQQQLIASLVTDKNGIAKSTPDNKAFLLIAEKEGQKAYLRLDPGSSLSMSQFDVGGVSVNKGIKGFIYGERGVWRPGDTLFLTFILEDRQQKLPSNHPVLLELYDPLGKKVTDNTSLSGLNGFYSFRIPTDPDAPTGNWNAKITAGNLTFNQWLRIETIKPNRLKINLDFGKEELPSDIVSIRGKLSSSWLHGALASNLKAKVSVNFKNISTTFPGYGEYIFSDPSRIFQPTELEVFDGSLNSEGKAEIISLFDIRGQSPGKVQTIFTSRIFEKGGDFSTDQYSITHSPYPAYTGLKVPSGDKYGVLLTDTLQRFEVVSLDEKGSLISVKNLQVKIYKLDWKWWWHSADENLASYVGSSYYKPVFEKTINTVNGKAAFNFRVDQPDWGRFFVRVYDPQSQHATGNIVYFDWPGWAGRDDRKDPSAASILTFSADKNTYRTGETATITIPSGEGGRILLSIENGSAVIDHHWIKTTGGETSFSFNITKEMTPNVYVHATFIQPHMQTKNDLPIRMYGVIPLLVEDISTHLEPVIKMPDVLKPESIVDLTITEKNGKEMTYTIAMVDEGLLDLTRFKTPDPWNSFYAREALGVKTFDVYDMVLGAYGGRIDGVFSIGGDEEAVIDRAPGRTKRFPPVVRYLGPFHLSSGKSQTHRISIPNYVGSVKTMVVAAYRGAYGNTEKISSVKKPLMVLASFPRVLGPSETASLPVTIFAMDDQIKNVDIQIETNDIFDQSLNRQSIRFERPGDATVDFVLKTGEVTGKGTVKVIASSGTEQSVYDIEMDIRSPNPEVTQYVYGIAEPGATWTNNFTLPGMKGTNTGALEVSSMPPLDFGRHLKFLLSYPHGCSEQIISKAFPQLFLTDVMDVNEPMKKMIQTNVETAIKQISSLQVSGGGVAYWPGATEANDWVTSYAGHFMLEAKKKGYHIPETFLKNWLRYQRNTARGWTGSSYQSEWDRSALELSQAYRLYTLALAGAAETGAMNRLREKADVTSITLWRLSAAYALAGQPEAARKLTQELTTNAKEYKDPGVTYGSELRDMAMILESMVHIGEREKAIPILQEISDRLSSERWYSTQTTAYALIAVTNFFGGSKTSGELNYEYNLNSEAVMQASVKKPYSLINHNFGTMETGSVSVKNKGDGLVYIRLALHGIPLAGKEKSESNNLSISVNYLDMSGNPIDVTRLDQGSDFIAVTSVNNPGTLGHYRDLALTQIFPSGWEIHNLRLFESNTGTFSSPEYQDIRDDRVNTYFNLQSGTTERFAVKLNAAYKGRFYLPGVNCEAMYRKDISALQEGKWVEVVEAGK